MDCVCVPLKGLMGKTKYFNPFEQGMVVSAFEQGMVVSAFEQGMVVGARRTGLNVPKTATLLGFSR